MQFNSEANSQDLISDITFWTGQDTGNYSLNDRTRNINNRFAMIWAIIFEAYGGWKFMDDNVSDASSGLPYAEQTITSGTGLYGIPTGALTIDSVWFRSTSGGPLNKLIPISHEQFYAMGGDSRFPTTGVPEFYMLQGDIIRVLPTPNFTLASTGIRVYFEQGMSNFVPSDTTKVPGFASIFHRALSIGGALDYALANPQTVATKVTVLNAEWEKFAGNPESGARGSIQKFYSKRFRELFPSSIGAGSDLVEEFS